MKSRRGENKLDDWFSGPISLFYDLRLKIKDERLRQVWGGLILAGFGVAYLHLKDLFADNQMANLMAFGSKTFTTILCFSFPHIPLIFSLELLKS